MTRYCKLVFNQEMCVCNFFCFLTLVFVSVHYLSVCLFVCRNVFSHVLLWQSATMVRHRIYLKQKQWRGKGENEDSNFVAVFCRQSVHWSVINLSIHLSVVVLYFSYSLSIYGRGIPDLFFLFLRGYLGFSASSKTGPAAAAAADIGTDPSATDCRRSSRRAPP